jgi:hypothetical protein
MPSILIPYLITYLKFIKFKKCFLINKNELPVRYCIFRHSKSDFISTTIGCFPCNEERERQTDRQTDRQADGQAGRQATRAINIVHTYKLCYTCVYIYIYIYIYIHTHTHTQN